MEIDRADLVFVNINSLCGASDMFPFDKRVEFLCARYEGPRSGQR